MTAMNTKDSARTRAVEAELSNAQKNLKGAMDRITRLETELAKRKLREEELRGQLSAAQTTKAAAVEATQRKDSETQRQSAAFAAQLKELEKALTVEKNRAKTAEQTAARYRSEWTKLADYDRRMQKMVSELQEKNAKIWDESNSQRAALKEVTEERARLATQLEALQRSVETTKLEAARAAAEVTRLGAELQQAKASFARSESDKSALIDQIREIQGNSTAAHELREKLAVAAGTSVHHEREMKRLEAQLSDAEKKVKAGGQALEASAARVAELTARLKRTDDEKTALLVEISRLTANAKEYAEKANRLENELRTQAEKAASERNALQLQVAEAIRNLDSRHCDVVHAQDSATEAMAKAEMTERELQEAIARNEVLRKEAAELRSRVDALTRSLEDTKIERVALGRKAAEYETALSGLLAERQAHAQAMETAANQRHALEKAIHDVEAKLQEAEAAKARLWSELTQSTSAAKENKAIAAATQERLAEAQARRDELAAENSTLLARIEALAGTARDHSDETAEWIRAAKEAQGKVEQLTQEKQALLEAANVTTLRISDLESMYQQLEARAAGYEQELLASLKERDEAEARMAEMAEEHLRSLNGTADTLRADAAAMKSSYEQQLAEARRRMDVLDGELKQALKKDAESQAGLERLKEQLEHAKALREDFEATRAKLVALEQERLEWLRREGTLLARIEQLGAANAGLQAEVVNLRDEVMELKDGLQASNEAFQESSRREAQSQATMGRIRQELLKSEDLCQRLMEERATLVKRGDDAYNEADRLNRLAAESGSIAQRLEIEKAGLFNALGRRESELATAQVKIEKLEEERAKAVEGRILLEQELLQSREAFQRVQGHARDLEQLRAGIWEELNTAQNQLVETQELSEKRQEALTAAQARILELENAVEERRTTIVAAEAELERLRAEMKSDAARHAALEELHARTSASLAALKSELKTVRASLREEQENRARVEFEAARLKKDGERFAAEASGEKMRADALHAKLSETMRTLASSEKEAASEREKKESCEALLREAESERDDLSRAAIRVKAEAEELRRQLAMSAEQDEARLAELQAASEQLVEAQLKSDELAREITTLRANMEASEAQRRQAQADAALAKAAIVRWEQEAARAQQRIQALSGEQHSAAGLAAEREHEMQRLSRALEQAEARLKANQASTASLRAERDEARQARQELDREHQATLARLANAVQQLEIVENERAGSAKEAFEAQLKLKSSRTIEDETLPEIMPDGLAGMAVNRRGPEIVN